MGRYKVVVGLFLQVVNVGESEVQHGSVVILQLSEVCS